MRIFADLHVHSKYSRAVSQDMDLAHIDACGVYGTIKIFDRLDKASTIQAALF